MYSQFRHCCSIIFIQNLLFTYFGFVLIVKTYNKLCVCLFHETLLKGFVVFGKNLLFNLQKEKKEYHTCI